MTDRDSAFLDEHGEALLRMVRAQIASYEAAETPRRLARVRDYLTERAEQKSRGTERRTSIVPTASTHFANTRASCAEAARILEPLTTKGPRY